MQREQWYLPTVVFATCNVDALFHVRCTYDTFTPHCAAAQWCSNNLNKFSKGTWSRESTLKYEIYQAECPCVLCALLSRQKPPPVTPYATPYLKSYLLGGMDFWLKFSWNFSHNTLTALMPPTSFHSQGTVRLMPPLRGSKSIKDSCQRAKEFRSTPPPRVLAVSLAEERSANRTDMRDEIRI